MARAVGWRHFLQHVSGIVLLIMATPLAASTFFPEEQVCPIGGEKFEYIALGSITTWGAMPDGMPLGSGRFPILLPQCPGNGLVMYRDFAPSELASLRAFIDSSDYQALRAARETEFYLAYRIAKLLGDPSAPGLLLSATWQAKNERNSGGRAQRYNEEFVALVLAMPASEASLRSIALRARAANSLRELGRFVDAEMLRKSILSGLNASGGDVAAENREGWRKYLEALAAPIARADQSRKPADMDQ